MAYIYKYAASTYKYLYSLKTSVININNMLKNIFILRIYFDISIFKKTSGDKTCNSLYRRENKGDQTNDRKNRRNHNIFI